MAMTEQELKKDKLCWSVFASASSSVSIAGLLLYISGIRNFGAILLSFGIQVLIIAFLFYCWTRCWRRIKPDEKTLDPPPPYKNEWRIAYLTARRFIEGSAQASSDADIERDEPVSVIKVQDTEILHADFSVEASASSNPEIEPHNQRRGEHALPMEHGASEIDTRTVTSETSSAWRSVNLLTTDQIELSGVDLFYKTYPEAHYLPAHASNHSDLPSYQEALARCKVNEPSDDPPAYTR